MFEIKWGLAGLESTESTSKRDSGVIFGPQWFLCKKISQQEILNYGKKQYITLLWEKGQGTGWADSRSGHDGMIWKGKNSTYKEEMMDIYTPSLVPENTWQANRWTLAHIDQPKVDIGDVCSVKKQD
jgi:hypothetical protein